MSDQSIGFGEGLSSDGITLAFKNTVEKEINQNTKNGLPIARYNVNTKRAYLEAADGSRKYVDEK